MADVCCRRRPGRRVRRHSRGLIEAVPGRRRMSRLEAMRSGRPDHTSERACQRALHQPPIDAPLARHEESVGVKCSALRASSGNG
jgi:hypothetical protein